LLQLVNSLQSKLEIGSPLASLYLLGLPDHYVSHTFVDFWWQTFIGAVQADINEDSLSRRMEEKVVLRADQEKLYGTSYVDHYRFRPEEYENLTLYEWIQTSGIRKIPQPRKKKDTVNE
ncbi:hypothetical protein K435DRAFT_613560, partial [Dendrothele bispora CBS 962.96]